jgi:hypothetical protein
MIKSAFFRNALKKPAPSSRPKFTLHYWKWPRDEKIGSWSWLLTKGRDQENYLSRPLVTSVKRPWNVHKAKNFQCIYCDQALKAVPWPVCHKGTLQCWVNIVSMVLISEQWIYHQARVHCAKHITSWNYSTSVREDLWALPDHSHNQPVFWVPIPVIGLYFNYI